jgi:hypothetical protein
LKIGLETAAERSRILADYGEPLRPVPRYFWTIFQNVSLLKTRPSLNSQRSQPL